MNPAVSLGRPGRLLGGGDVGGSLPLCQEKAKLTDDHSLPIADQSWEFSSDYFSLKRQASSQARRFCFPQMGIISLFGSWADSSGSRRGLRAGCPWLQAALREQTLPG